MCDSVGSNCPHRPDCLRNAARGITVAAVGGCEIVDVRCRFLIQYRMCVAYMCSENPLFAFGLRWFRCVFMASRTRAAGRLVGVCYDVYDDGACLTADITTPRYCVRAWASVSVSECVWVLECIDFRGVYTVRLVCWDENECVNECVYASSSRLSVRVRPYARYAYLCVAQKSLTEFVAVAAVQTVCLE